MRRVFIAAVAILAAVAGKTFLPTIISGSLAIIRIGARSLMRSNGSG